MTVLRLRPLNIFERLKDNLMSILMLCSRGNFYIVNKNRMNIRTGKGLLFYHFNRLEYKTSIDFRQFMCDFHDRDVLCECGSIVNPRMGKTIYEDIIYNCPRCGSILTYSNEVQYEAKRTRLMESGHFVESQKI